MATMTSRERVLTAMRRQQPDRVPRATWCEHYVERDLKARLNISDLDAFFQNDMRHVLPAPSVLKTDFSRYFDRECVWTEWGFGRIWDQEEHYAEYLYPLEKAEKIEAVETYPWPDLDAPYRYRGVKEQVEALHAQGFAVEAPIGSAIFEFAWQLRSMDRLFEDMLTDPDMATAYLDKITDIRVAMVRQLARAGADILDTGDDVAMQSGLMMNREMFNHWFRPRFERIIRAAKEENPDILFWYHSDGKINDLIPDLIDMGADILNPVQPECVDHRWVKDTYGDRIAFSGGLGVQSIIPFGTPDQVREHVREVIATLGAGGGLFVGPSHVIERDTPFENIMAMLDAMEEYGIYE